MWQCRGPLQTLNQGGGVGSELHKTWGPPWIAESGGTRPWHRSGHWALAASVGIQGHASCCIFPRSPP